MEAGSSGWGSDAWMPLGECKELRRLKWKELTGYKLTKSWADFHKVTCHKAGFLIFVRKTPLVIGGKQFGFKSVVLFQNSSLISLLFNWIPNANSRIKTNVP